MCKRYVFWAWSARPLPHASLLLADVSSSNYRAKDRYGLAFVSMAAQLNNDIPASMSKNWFAGQGISERDYRRARLSTHWMVTCFHM